ncbi:MAG TPA: YdaS family helix-turn-helix protein [Vineibacter sp.]|nr:YdaS family helix-turn-helix protein [Vineibacter sp.]
MSATPLQKAIELAGGQSALARLVGKRQSNVWRWLKAGRVPAEFASLIEAKLDGRISRHELRPDIYGPSGGAINGFTAAQRGALGDAANGLAVEGLRVLDENVPDVE